MRSSIQDVLPRVGKIGIERILIAPDGIQQGLANIPCAVNQPAKCAVFPSKGSDVVAHGFQGAAVMLHQRLFRQLTQHGKER